MDERLMKILHVLGSFGHGGAEMGVVRLINSFPDKSVKHAVCSFSSDLAMKKKLIKDISCYSLDVSARDYKVFLKLLKILKAEKVDLVHVNNIGPWFDSAIASFLWGCPCIMTFHGIENAFFKFKPIKKLQFKIASKLTSKITSVSEAASNLFLDISNLNRKIEVILNGVDTDYFAPVTHNVKEELKLNLGYEGKTVIGCVAALREVKNHKGLIECFKDLNLIFDDCVLVCLGDGPLYNDLIQFVTDSALYNNVLLKGRKDKVNQYLQSFDVFVLNSKTEGLSYAILEAMSCGLPVVATKVGGNKELIVNKEDGFLVEEGSQSLLLLTLQNLVKDIEIRKEIGEKARKKIIGNYSINNMLIKYNELYKKIVLY